MKLSSFFILVGLSLLPTIILHANGVPPDVGFAGDYPVGTIAREGLTLIGVLALIQSILLKVLLPIVVIGSSLYIAYELFTAEGDETKMKKAWKSIAFSAVGLISIAVSYAFVELLSTISI